MDIITENIVLQPKFIKGTKGDLFTLFVPPATQVRTVFLFLPSFAEELNRCRVMVAMQVRQMASLGYGCLVLDYYGTGDSQGDFSETSWHQWQADVDTAYEWLLSQCYTDIGIWGLRLGAMLAIERVIHDPKRFNRVLLWQPVLDGKVLMNQFLRLRVAMLMDRGLKKQTTQEMRQLLEQGKSIEVAGYEVTPELYFSIEQQKIMDYLVVAELPPIDWFEVVINEDDDYPISSQRVFEKWRAEHVDIQAYSYTGAFFWQLHERELTPNLLDKTLKVLQNKKK
jgi:exosortase A-associated hydrolase 2